MQFLLAGTDTYLDFSIHEREVDPLQLMAFFLVTTETWVLQVET